MLMKPFIFVPCRGALVLCIGVLACQEPQKSSESSKSARVSILSTTIIGWHNLFVSPMATSASSVSFASPPPSYISIYLIYSNLI